MNRDIFSCSNVANRDVFFLRQERPSSTAIGKKTFESPPSDLQCSDRAQASTTGSGRPSCVDVVLGFPLNVLVRRDQFQNRQNFPKYSYAYFIKSLQKLDDTCIPNMLLNQPHPGAMLIVATAHCSLLSIVVVLSFCTFRGLLPSGHVPVRKEFDAWFACVWQYLITFKATVILCSIVPMI